MSDIDSSTAGKLTHVRSLLFAPGNDERKLRRALESDADAVVADLEDAVPLDEKSSARRLGCRLLADVKTTTAKAIRVNGVGSAFFADDLAAIRGLRLDAVVLPKATPEAVAALEVDIPVVAIVESAEGLRRSYELSTMPEVHAVVLGAVDLALETGLEPLPGGEHLLYARSKLVFDAAAAGIRAPIDQVWVDTRDEPGLERDALTARALGLRGKACIHPAQVGVVNRVFSPSASDVERARAIVDAYESALEEGRGAVALDGAMIDLPIVERARRLLADAERSTVHGY